MQDAKKSPKKSPSGHHHTNLSGYIFATKARIDNRKKILLSSNISSTCPHNMVILRPTSGRDRSGSLGHPCKFQRLLHLASVTAWHSSSGHEPNCGVEQRAPPRWPLAHISSNCILRAVFLLLHLYLNSCLVINVCRYVLFMFVCVCPVMCWQQLCHLQF